MNNSKSKTLIFTLLFPYIYLILFLAIPTNVIAVLPHDIRAVNTAITLEGIEQNSSIHTVSVIAMPYVTPFMLMIYNLSSRVDLRTPSINDQDLTIFERARQARLSKESSLISSVIVSYTLAMNSNPNVIIEYQFTGLRINYRDPIHHQLNIADQILSVNGINESAELMIQEFRTSETLLLEIRPYDKIDDENSSQTFQIENIGKGWSFFSWYNIDQEVTYPKFSFPILNQFIGGPSGGAMQTLSLYVDLTEIKINQKIVGTGTINSDGSVGRIGGLRQKVYAALDANATIFFLPASQFNEVADLTNKIRLVPINNIEEAIGVIHEINQ